VLVSLQKNDHDFEPPCALKGAFVLCAYFVSFVLFVAKKEICLLFNYMRSASPQRTQSAQRTHKEGIRITQRAPEYEQRRANN
jgi:hypothetical protein